MGLSPVGGALRPLLKNAPLSKSAVSRIVATPRGEWEAWRKQSLADLNVVYLYLDAIALMTIIRGPGNKSCGNTTVVAENTLVPPYVDQALADVASRAPDLVMVAPKYEAAACSDFMETGPHLTAAGDTAIAKTVAATFANP